MKESSTTTAPEATSVAIRRLLLCGVDGSRTDAETVRQAAVLAGGDGALDIVCVSFTTGYGLTEKSLITETRAERALREAQQLADELGVRATSELVTNRERWSGIESRLAGHDLLVLGAHERSRAEGILGGSLATEALHRSPVPVLIVRPAEQEFPKHIVFATDGGPDCRLAAAFTLAIARRHGAAVTLLTVGSESEAGARRSLAEDAAGIFRGSGIEPVIVTATGSPRTAIVEVVRAQRPSLVVLGSGGKLGVRAISSVSEHVAHHVPCSVLVARGPRD